MVETFCGGKQNRSDIRESNFAEAKTADKDMRTQKNRSNTMKFCRKS